MDKQLKSYIDRLAKWNVATFERKGKDFSFSEIFPLVLKIHQALLDFRDNPEFWTQLPQQRQAEITNNLPPLISAIESMGNFNPQQNSPLQEQHNIVSKILAQYNALYAPLFQPLDIYLLKQRYQSSDIESLISNAKNTLDEVKKSDVEAKKVLDGMRSASLKESTASFAEIFEDQAKRNRNAAIAWLIVTVFAAIGILWFVWTHLIGIFEHPDNPAIALTSTNTLPTVAATSNATVITSTIAPPSASHTPDLADALPSALSKFIFVSLLTAFFYQIVKNMNSNMHLFTLNRHKANCLRTMKALQESSDDPRTREVVLMQATKAIFELNETGFISSKEISCR